MNKKYKIKSKIRFTLFITIMLVIMISAIGTVIGTNTVDSLTKNTFTEIQVQSGDTLWDLANEFGPDDKDIRKVVYEICKLNNISADGIFPGQKLLIPKYI